MEAVAETVKLKVYDCQVRPGGHIMHSLPLLGANERELKVLRTIHGNDCVVSLTHVDTKEFDELELFMELAHKYGRPRIEQIFKVSLDNFDGWLEAKQVAAEEERSARGTAAEQPAAQSVAPAKKKNGAQGSME